MDRAQPLVGIVERAIDELRTAFGAYTGQVVSGSRTPAYREVLTGEGITSLTTRVMVAPVVEYIGYHDYIHDETFTLLVVRMNDRVGEHAPELLNLMRHHGSRRGIVTDGFTWILAGNGRVRSVADIRPFYVATLDRMTFGGTTYIPRGELYWLVDRFGRDRD